MSFLRASRVKLVWGLELALGLELYACAVLALHARGLRATPLLASPGLVIPALVIPPVFYVLVALVSVRPLSAWRLMAAVGAMCGVHSVLVVATGALFVIPDLVDYGAAVAFSLWGSPAVTMLQLTAAPLVLARLRPLLVPPRSAMRPAARAASPQRQPETPGAVPPSSTSREPAATALPAQRERAAVAPAAPRPPAATPTAAPRTPSGPVAVAPATPAVREPVVTPAAVPAPRTPAVISREATPFATGVSPRAALEPAVPKPAAVQAEPMVRVSFSRIAEQLPVEMFVRGRKGLSDTLRPGVSLLVPRSLLLPHLADGVAPVRWTVVADQFPRDELKLTHQEIESRLPDGSLLLPLDEVVPQIPAELLALSTPAVDVPGIEGFPAPFQSHLPSSATTADDVDTGVPDRGAPKSALVDGVGREAPTPEVEVSQADVPETEGTEEPEEAEELEEPEEAEEPEADVPEIHVLKLEALEIEVPEAEVQELAVQELAASVLVGPRLAAVKLEDPVRSEAPEPPTVDHGRTAEARRIAALMAPVMNGLQIGERAGAGTPLVTVVAPTLSEDAVVATAVRIAPLLTDGRLSEPVSQATLTAPEATIVLTPIESPDGGALLVTALASRASLAWLERLSRSAAGEPRGAVPIGARASGESQADELRATVVPPVVRELAGSFTAFGPIMPTVLRDTVGLFRVCLFVPSSIDVQPLAQLARDLYTALEGAEVGRVASVILRLGTYRLVMRAVAASSGQTTILVGGGPIARPGLARIELDRAAAQLAALGRG